MRICLVIVSLAAVAVTVVHLRRAETRAHCQVQCLQAEQIHLKRKLYDQQATIARLTSPSQVRQRAQQMNAELRPYSPRPTPLPPDVAMRGR